MIAHAMPAAFRDIEQGGDLGVRKELLGPLVSIRGTRRTSFDISPFGRWSPRSAKPLMNLAPG